MLLDGPLTASQLATFKEAGFLVLERFIPDELTGAVVADIFCWLDAAANHSDTWYHNDPSNYTQIPIHHPQSLWNVRQYQPLYRAYAQLWAESDLVVSIDRVSFKPPWSDHHPDHNLDRRIHWDVDPIGPRRQIQGVVYLSDNAPGGGCFECIPGVHRIAERWIRERGISEGDYFRLPVTDSEVVPASGPIGTVVLFDSRLPHGSGANRTDRPRMAQYVQMYPRRDEKDMAERIECWRMVRPPRWSANEGWVGLRDPEPFPRPVLTLLGSRLLGLA